MKAPSVRSQPRIVWQATLILLPVLLLAAVGVYFLREDRRRAEQDLRDQAQGFAETVLEVYERELRDLRDAPPGQVITFVTDAAGELLDPAPVERVPTPPALRWDELTNQQRAAWERATFAEAQQDWENAASAWRKFVESKPPSDIQAIAWYKLGLSLKRKSGDGRGDLNTLKGGQQAADAFAVVIERFPDARGDSGLPLQPLARLQWIETAQAGAAEKLAALSALASNALRQPSILNAQLLDRLGQWQSRLIAEDTNRTWKEPLPFEALQKSWAQQEEARALHRLMLPSIQSVLKRPGFMWVDDEEGASAGGAARQWLAYGLPEETNRFEIVCKLHEAIEPKGAIAALERSRFPSYLGVRLHAAGRPVLATKNGQRLLATAVRSANGEDYLEATIYLANPALFQQRLRTRTFWLGAVIASAAVAGLVGLLSAWRAFRRQQALADMKTNFVSSVSHELRAPIASVRLLAEGLESGKIHDAAKQHQYLGFIVQECRRLSSLIDNVLDFSRIEEGRKQYQIESTDLKALVHKTVELMKTYAEEKAVRLEVAANGDGLTADVDGRAIQQALVNLIDNALKHSPAESSVQVGLDAGQNGVAFRLWVQDRGAGIPAEDHERIFERFYRRGSELRRETQGVGIGLSIVKHIVEAHRGRVLVDSEPGKGSRFTIEIP